MARRALEPAKGELALAPLKWPLSHEDIRQAALRALANPPTNNLETWARVLRTVARVHSSFDLPTAILVQAEAQRMNPTPEGARSLERMRAELQGLPSPPVSEADQNSRRREFEELKRGSRHRNLKPPGLPTGAVPSRPATRRRP